MASYSYPRESGKQAPTPVDWIPDEVLLETLRCLPLESLGNARLSCRRWSRVGAGLWNLSRIYFRPHNEVVRGFEAIANNPVLATKVHELIFDARLFWFLQQPQVSGALVLQQFDDVWHLRGPGMNIEIDHNDGYDQLIAPYRVANMNRYTHMYSDQQHVLDSQLDFKILSEGLHKLTNLKVVSIGPEFPNIQAPSDNHPLAWYGSKSNNLWRNVIEPCQYHHFRGEVWDERPLQSLLRSISMQEQGIEKFQYGTLGSPLPATALLGLGVPTKVHPWTSSITCLKIHCSHWPKDPLVLDYQRSFTQVLQNVPNLRHLSLSNITTGSDWESVLCNILWEHLTKLELHHYTLNLDTIKSICFVHKQTLQELTLKGIVGNPPPQLKGWTSLAANIGACLRLDRVHLGELTRERAKPTGMLDKRELNTLCSSIMQWIPVNMRAVHEPEVSIGSVGRWVTMWKRTSESSTLPETDGDF